MIFLKIWNLRVKTNQIDEPVEIFVSPNFFENNEKLYLLNIQTDQITDMLNENLIFFAEDTIYYDFRLYWGDLHPIVDITNMQNQLLQGGDELLIEWQSNVYQLIEYFDISLQNEETTIVIADSVGQMEDQFIWETPEDIEIHNAHIVIGIHATDGIIYEYSSTASFGIVPLVYTIEFVEGWQLITNPWNSDDPYYVSDIFGPNSDLLFPLPDNNFEMSDVFNFGIGYWLNAEAEGYFTHSNAIIKDNYSIPLNPGWNLIPNPYLCSYNPRNFGITNSGSTFPFGYAVEEELIANVAYVYREGIFVETDTINPYEAFYLYVNEDGYDNMECMFYPYYSGYYAIPGVDWEIAISTTQTDSDGIILGCSEHATDSFDNIYDLPEAPVKPVENGIKIYLPKNSHPDSLYLYSELDREIKLSLETGLPESKLWNFVLEIQILDAVTFEFDMLDLPESYYVDIQIDGNSWNQLTSGSYIYSIIPSRIGAISGSVLVSNNVVTSDDIVSTGYDFINYPNPFNPSTKIRFNVPEEGRVELSIYNIKGQKVKTICKEILQSGNHEYRWEGKNNSNNNVASGIYFIRLNNGEKTKVRKVLLLK